MATNEQLDEESVNVDVRQCCVPLVVLLRQRVCVSDCRLVRTKKEENRFSRTLSKIIKRKLNERQQAKYKRQAMGTRIN